MDITTAQESLVYDWLTKRRIYFDFQSSLMGGRLEWGGIQAEFILPDDAIVIRVDPINQEEQRVIIEQSGYRVVDIEDKDLSFNLDLVMSRAIQGDEMSPIDSGLHKSGLFASKGFAPYTKDHSSVTHSSQVVPIVTTEAPTAISSGTATMNGTLTYDGGYLCKCKFSYRTCTLQVSSFPYTFPFSFYGKCQFIGGFPYTFPISFFEKTWSGNAHVDTAWQQGKKTGDTFDKTLLGLSGSYSYIAIAQNDYDTAYGVERTLTGV